MLDTATEPGIAASSHDDPTSLYRHFAADGRLLYVGVSLHAVGRLCQHRDHSAWFTEIARVEIEQFPSRKAALDAEREAIQSEKPLHNKNKRGKPPRDEVTRRPEAGHITGEREYLTYRLVSLKPIYKLCEAAELLAMGPSRLQRLIDNGQIGSLMLPTKYGDRPHVSGWQLLEFIEVMGGDLTPARTKATTRRWGATAA
jgi:hypothetical protein